MLELVKYIKRYGLEETLDKYKLKSKEYSDKILIKYNQIDSNMGEKVVQESRGIVLEKNTWKVMSLGFKKFFNSAEGHAAKIDWNTAQILEKLDGTCIVVYWDWNKKEWFAGTTGTAEGEGEVNNKRGTTFNDLFWDTVGVKYGLTRESKNLDTDYVYVFELTTPHNIVVKPHAKSSATLLTIRNISTLEELPFHKVHNKANLLGVPIVKTYNLSGGNVGELIRTFEDMPWYDEGYVVVDDKHNRVKVKNPAYVSVHHLKSKTSEHAIMGVIKNNEVDEFISTFPDRSEEINELKNSYEKLIKKLENGWEKLKPIRPKNITPGEKKKFAMAVFEVVDNLDIKSFSGLYFNLNNGNVNSVKEFMLNYDNKKLYKII